MHSSLKIYIRKNIFGFSVVDSISRFPMFILRKSWDFERKNCFYLPCFLAAKKVETVRKQSEYILLKRTNMAFKRHKNRLKTLGERSKRVPRTLMPGLKKLFWHGVTAYGALHDHPRQHRPLKGLNNLGTRPHLERSDNTKITPTWGLKTLLLT